MGKQNKRKTAPDQEGAVLNQEVVAETETVIEEVIKDALDATNEAKVITKTDAEAQAKADEEAQAKADAEAQAKADAEAQAKEEFEYKGVLYTFVDETPETLSLDEGLFSRKEILSNRELMQSLIEDNCIFIKQV